MYLYFNKEGILSTIIPHGETVRQGSYLNIYVLLDDDFFVDRGESIEQYSVNVELAFPNNTIGTVSTIPVNEPKLLPFEKLDDSEITYELIDGAQYWTYHFRFTPNQATLYAGKIFAMVSVMQTELTDPDNIESAIEKDLLYYGKADIYVEKVFGIARRMVDESQLHYKNLVIQLNELNKRKTERLNISLTGNPIKNLLYQLISGRYNGTYVVNGEYTAKCTFMSGSVYSVQLQTLNAEGKISIYRCTDNAETISEDTLTYNSTTLREINVEYNDNGVMLINGEKVINNINLFNYYRHSIFIISNYPHLVICTTVYCKKNNSFNSQSFTNWLYANGHDAGNPLSCSGAFLNNIIIGIYTNGNDIYLIYSNGSSIMEEKIILEELNFTDKFVVA